MPEEWEIPAIGLLISPGTRPSKSNSSHSDFGRTLGHLLYRRFLSSSSPLLNAFRLELIRSSRIGL